MQVPDAEIDETVSSVVVDRGSSGPSSQISQTAGVTWPKECDLESLMKPCDNGRKQKFRDLSSVLADAAWYLT